MLVPKLRVPGSVEKPGSRVSGFSVQGLVF